jgi:Caspase domain
MTGSNPIKFPRTLGTRLGRWPMAALAALLLCCAWNADRACAQQRVALVIGNGAYRNVTALPNPKNDASDVGTALERLGFAVNKVSDAAFDDLRRALLDFGRRARAADMAVVFYAGHGMEIGGENWLIPIDAELKTDLDAEGEAISLRSVMSAVSTARVLGLVILDACRNNPFAAKMQRTFRTRAVQKGLSAVEPSDNVFVAYAAKDGTTAGDGIGRNSPFTAALLKHIETPGLEIQFLFRTVRDDVMEATQREQQPFVYGSLSKEAIYLKAGPSIQPSASTRPEPASDVDAAVRRDYEFADRAGSREAWGAFVARYPTGYFADLARVQIAKLAAPTPPNAASSVAIAPIALLPANKSSTDGEPRRSPSEPDRPAAGACGLEVKDFKPDRTGVYSFTVESACGPLSRLYFKYRDWTFARAVAAATSASATFDFFAGAAPLTISSDRGGAVVVTPTAPPPHNAKRAVLLWQNQVELDLVPAGLLATDPRQFDNFAMVNTVRLADGGQGTDRVVIFIAVPKSTPDRYTISFRVENRSRAKIPQPPYCGGDDLDRVRYELRLYEDDQLVRGPEFQVTPSVACGAPITDDDIRAPRVRSVAISIRPQY